MPYPSPDVLAAAATDLGGSHPLTIVTIPALLRAGRSTEDEILEAGRLPTIAAFGTKQERPVLEAFRLRDHAKSPYLAVWQDPPVFIRSDYPGSTLQRLRTQDLLGQQLFDIAWNNDHSKRVSTALRPTAGAALTQRHVKPVNRLSLALWLGRDQDLPNLESFLDWFDTEYPLDQTDLADFYARTLPPYAQAFPGIDGPLWLDAASNEDITATIQPAEAETETLDVPSTTPPAAILAPQAGTEAYSVDDDLHWTRDFCAYPLRDADIGRIVRAVTTRLDEARIVLPDVQALVSRCAAALLTGHLILQGPPGTGKTSLARILAEAFEVRLLEATATSEWSPFHVVGGLRPGRDNSLRPSYGKVTDAALKCAVHVREDVNAEAAGGDDGLAAQARRWQGAWLLIDEFNRADIDKAIGSLYTMLSSCDAPNLERSPIDLWFETEGRQQLWVPSRFRIIAAMNDLDTSFVNPISQGLTRRFQFITIGVPAATADATVISAEIQNSLSTAYAWLSSTYGGVLSINPLNAIVSQIGAQITITQTLINGLRAREDAVVGWPIGTAQVVDLFRVLLLQLASGVEATLALDWAVTDRLVPQMGQLDEAQVSRAGELFEAAQLGTARRALQHLLDPHSA